MRRPNIILISAEHLRWDCLGYAGNPDVRTPNLDILAAHAVNFSQAIAVHTDSGASRHALLTGLYARRHGVLDAGASLDAETPTLPGCLRAAGYDTAGVGKMGFHPARADCGFDTLLLAEQSAEGRASDDYHAWLKEQQKHDRIDAWDQIDRESAPKTYWKSFGAMRSNLPEAFHSTTWIGRQAVRSIQSIGSPFFLYVNFIKPRHPFDPPAPWDEMYDREALQLPGGFCCPAPKEDATEKGYFDPEVLTEPRFRKVLAHYYASISHVDQQIGRMLATLTARGIANNIIVFCGTNGEYLGHHGLLASSRGRPYDAALRIPLLIAGCPKQRHGITEPALAEITDLMPTLLEAAGLGVSRGMSGRSLLPQLLQTGAALRSVAYAESDNKIQIARSSQFKLIEEPAGKRSGFYDLNADPHEWDNLYGSNPPQQGELRAFLEKRASA